MTIGKCIGIAETIAPNKIDRELKLRWLSELEGKIAVELFDAMPEELNEYSAECEDGVQLYVPFPFDQIYWMYLVAMLDLANGDNARYGNSAGAFNSAFESYAKWVLRNGVTR
ncbi:MAG: hypothetical protein IJX74_00540 [Clostridia bacterium]|nr:hypothetical protein [Clostridia bacterium]